MSALTQKLEEMNKFKADKQKRNATKAEPGPTAEGVNPPTEPANPLTEPAAQNVFSLNKEIMTQVINLLDKEAKEIRKIHASIRYTSEEQQFIEKFVANELSRLGFGLRDKSISISSLMRYAIFYVLINHRNEFAQVLADALLQEKTLDVEGLTA